ncbi:hypothetical protein SAMN05444678_103104 [Sphingomonas sp. YR710]|jgi:hypothetical protein|uniref:hypothetical protein n=1 Tax=Sphingomonas sp. YR710 TaxID=1882773 RepID=UPI00088B406F|nr:hypothetical protein [Sphingomonas sp. YR710]SDC45784.1 hypothetical protein SAMN05444678_103104 [Sphingomonas sp. YR710]
MIFYILLATYLVTLLSSCAYAIRFGGQSELIGAGIMIAGSFLTPVVGFAFSKLHAHLVGAMLIDLAVLAAFLTLALRSDKFWPLWTTAFQIIGVATHLAKFVDPAIVPRAYSIAQGFWAYPMLAALVIGARADHIAAKSNAKRS